MKYRLLAIDMDGTFLNDNGCISERNLKAVKVAAAKGIMVVVCSGRIPVILRPILRDLPKNQPIIAGNGSVILDHNNKVFLSETIDKKAISEIANILRKDFDSVYYHFFDGNIVVSEKFQYVVEKYYKVSMSLPREYRVELRIIPDAVGYIESNNPKTAKMQVCHEDPWKLLEIRTRLEKVQGIEIASAGFDAIEITKGGFNKGTSLEILANHYGISLSECMAVGNDENDIEMIRRAGLGIAVRNAKEHVKTAARYITENSNNSDAVAEIIEKFL